MCFIISTSGLKFNLKEPVIKISMCRYIVLLCFISSRVCVNLLVIKWCISILQVCIRNLIVNYNLRILAIVLFVKM